MPTLDKTPWLYKNDLQNSIRYVLGTKGSRPLVCIGVNPSTATPNRLDATLRSVKRLTKANGYDSWLMINLYPVRAIHPKGLPYTFNKTIHYKNLECISRTISWENATIWAAWGNAIERRPYLISCLEDIVTVLSKKKCRWAHIGTMTRLGHPRHPLYVASHSKIQDIDIQNYIGVLDNKPHARNNF